MYMHYFAYLSQLQSILFRNIPPREQIRTEYQLFISVFAFEHVDGL